MAGNIYHEWNGTVLTITSDSGTSSCDLKGSKGDMGIRGAQGIPGVLVDSSGVVVADAENYYTKQETDDKVTDVKETLVAHDKRITNIERSLEPIRFKFDSATNYIKSVPEGALPYAEITKVGGMTYKEGNTLKHAKVTKVKSVGKNLLCVDANGYSQHVTVNVLDNNSFTVETSTTEEAPLYEFWEGELEAGHYTISFDLDIKNNVTAGRPNEILIFINDEVTSLLKVGESFPSNYEHTFNVSNRSNIMMAFYANITRAEYNNYKATFTNMQLEKGTVATEFKPYAEHTIEIPAVAQALDGYGVGVSTDCYNYIDWENEVFVKRVGSVDISTLDWVLGSVFYAEIDDRKSGDNAICSAYPIIPKVSADLMDNESISFNPVYNDLIYIKDTSYTDIESFKTAMSGELLHYELAEPQYIDISHLITNDNYIEVENGGLVIMENEHNLNMPNEIVYMVKGV